MRHYARDRYRQLLIPALFITVRTVAANLTRIYRKLGLHSRAELAAQWRETGQPCDPP